MSNRYTHYDSDAYRLPEGMRRVGYDADTQQYTFRDSQGYYIGEPANEYGGRLTYTSPLRGNERDDDIEFTPPSFTAVNSPYRPLLPFFLIVAVVLLVLVKFIYSGSSTHCKHGEYTISKGDTCWGIAMSQHVPLDQLQQSLPCNALIPGTRICLPERSA
ncbi:hypothetical protein E3P92_01254 [Wallemia ichthyophaga]|uniref:LysM domain-containing protein n=2 Tax=Wallemia ichthyophaga TaxID=245174 RepID=A0A4T0HR95_WALIC|nr:uncharacterized protein J056_000599 [Wallemia ichthyophaga EXF-994]TIA74453.1 hypothetical protein E3P91_00961 [Wallemia ichthyophaga]EOR00789.1 hypothetical protein J056_000599 [Wallemia ichthyophaga EXF-994]TIA82956.1 hypothetical protein E3P98_01081 [Wallemia ichthyophaga]TIA92857.1 hypothetical protein E3P97_01268 [Wallemia ichthyophaga]TIB06254.1 hypothetical protein E3P96_00626 [Wallemia ichthyophaga]